MIDQMARPPIVMTAQEAGDRCRKMSYRKDIHPAFNWTTPYFSKLLKTNWPWPADFIIPICTGEYAEKGPANCSGHHHMHGVPDKMLICCLCGWTWEKKRSEIQCLRIDLLQLLTNKLLEDELGF